MIITVSKKKEIVIFGMKGKFISPYIGKVLETVEQTLCDHTSYPKLVFDFKEITRIDCAGLGTLMKIFTQILPHGGKMAVINMNKNISNLTVMTQLSTVIECYKCQDDAITALLGDT